MRHAWTLLTPHRSTMPSLTSPRETNDRLYGLFNNGAYGQPGAVEDLSTAVLREQFETNFFGWHELTRAVIPIMRSQGYGRIIQNSSVLGLVSMKYRGAYNSSKHAIEGLTDTLRLELADSNIHVSLIEPGPVDTDFRVNALAAFRRNINTEDSAHAETYERVLRRLTHQGKEPPFTLPADAVLKPLIHALESCRPKPRYYLTLPTYAFGFLKRVLPSRWLDWVLQAASKGEHSDKAPYNR